MSWWAQDKNIRSRTSFYLVLAWLWYDCTKYDYWDRKAALEVGWWGSSLRHDSFARPLQPPSPPSPHPFPLLLSFCHFSRNFLARSPETSSGAPHAVIGWKEGWLSASRQLRPPRRRRWSGRQDPAGFPLPTPLLTHWHTGHTTRHNDSSKSEMDWGETERYSKHSERNTVDSRARRSSDTHQWKLPYDGWELY